MQRYFIEEALTLGTEIEVTDDIYHHMIRVMRMKEGEKCWFVDTNHELFQISVKKIKEKLVIVSIDEQVAQNVEMPINVAIACGLPKGDKLDLIVQKSTELGVNKIIPMTIVRNVVKWKQDKMVKKVSRLQKIAKEAAEQSHRLQIPEVTSVMSIKEIIALSKDYDATIVAYEEEAKVGEASAFAKTLASLSPGQSILMIFGSEGGLTPEEVEQMTQAGIIACGLGPRILRTETAPLYALAAISYHFELQK
ncbi:16S rRNA (uracil1498-N3)-methyltransferase [Granulicatella balaenopterae]|uniref:Ribosomal RNA small subunit methyltransferase E n=1 Tax=Granulicatella balaenopterae TaxID=137733 RepID=A0A1H9K164_9LACT|nr:16S rRNA (uracil(1498)-N(3))-methyltransferase [Granulicatella balaenopterae]SEQ92829.1 16S rRNA (uracil1498-N3)-methyltransferase [Granulicatella balaenopterae]